MALFHAKEDEKLMPIAIQLFQEPAPENPVSQIRKPKVKGLGHDSGSAGFILLLGLLYFLVVYFICTASYFPRTLFEKDYQNFQIRCFYQAIQLTRGC